MPEAWIIDAVRTPRGIGKVGKGALAAQHPQLHRRRRCCGPSPSATDLTTADVDDIIWGTSRQVGTQGGDLGRMAALDAGYDMQLERRDPGPLLRLGHHRRQPGRRLGHGGLRGLMIAGGTELMSSYGTNKVEGGGFFIDSGNEHLRAAVAPAQPGRRPPTPSPPSRASPASRSTSWPRPRQPRAAAAIAEGRFDRSLVPVHDVEGNVLLDHEEYPRPGTTVEKLAAAGSRRSRGSPTSRWTRTA